MKAKVRCIESYNDSELNTKITNNPKDKNYERVVSIERAIVLNEAGVCEILESFNEAEIENAKLDDNKEETENAQNKTNKKDKIKKEKRETK